MRKGITSNDNEHGMNYFKYCMTGSKKQK